MALILVATAGASNANSYCTAAEAQAYFDARTAVPEWDAADSQEALLVMATRVIDATIQPLKTYVPAAGGEPAYYRIRRSWTGAPTTPAVQVLAWPRTGMLNRNGYALSPALIPQDLKNAVAEFAGQLARADRTLDNDVLVQGITSVRAGSVSVSFKDSGIFPQVLPDAVYNLMPQSWFTDETIDYPTSAEFEFV